MKILISAFKPFGLRSKNISEEIIKELKNVDKKIVISVDNRGIEELRKTILKFKPDAIVCLGEDIMGKTRIEPYAIEKIRIYSPLAALLRKEFNSYAHWIGTYYCNDAYVVALKLNPNSVFIHLNAWNKEKNCKFVQKIIDKIRSIAK